MGLTVLWGRVVQNTSTLRG